jgi:hypothetical protein
MTPCFEQEVVTEPMVDRKPEGDASLKEIKDGRSKKCWHCCAKSRAGRTSIELLNMTMD